MSAAAALPVLLMTCGYSTRSLVPSHLKTVAISSVRNSTTQPGLSDHLLDSLSAAFARARVLRTSTTERADLLVSANITSYTRTATVYDAAQRISAYEIRLSASVEAEDRVRGEPYYSGPASSRVTYNPASQSEDQASLRALGELARDIVRAVLTAW